VRQQDASGDQSRGRADGGRGAGGLRIATIIVVVILVVLGGVVAGAVKKLLENTLSGLSDGRILSDVAGALIKPRQGRLEDALTKASREAGNAKTPVQSASGADTSRNGTVR